jgi:Mlc titration factor MtfA (ptsG expression regulator)
MDAVGVREPKEFTAVTTEPFFASIHPHILGKPL